ncbi:MAG: hypothetical protein HXS44_02330 [Theionarchaea archaeon]|nr:hypothetical protein [Theionarchaea archaeon]
MKDETVITCVEVTGTLKIDHNVRDLCRKPYPGHPKGCPNYGKKKECPPQAPLLEDFIDISQPHYFVVLKCIRNGRFPNQESTLEEAQFHSYWSDTLEKILCKYIQEFQKDHPGTVFTYHPSAVGVDVLETARNVGIPLQENPEKVFHKIVLIGYPVVRDPIE